MCLSDGDDALVLVQKQPDSFCNSAFERLHADCTVTQEEAKISVQLYRGAVDVRPGKSQRTGAIGAREG